MDFNNLSKEMYYVYPVIERLLIELQISTVNIEKAFTSPIHLGLMCINMKCFMCGTGFPKGRSACLY